MSVALRAHREWGWRSSEPPQERVGALPMLGLYVLRLAALQIDREEVTEPKESHAGPTQGWGAPVRHACKEEPKLEWMRARPPGGC